MFNFQVATGVLNQTKRSRATIYLMVALDNMNYYLNSPMVKGLITRTGYRSLWPDLTLNDYSYKSPVTIALKYTKTMFGKPTANHIIKIRLEMERGEASQLVFSYNNIEIFRGYGTLLTKLPEDFRLNSEYMKISKPIRRILK